MTRSSARVLIVVSALGITVAAAFAALRSTQADSEAPPRGATSGASEGKTGVAGVSGDSQATAPPATFVEEPAGLLKAHSKGKALQERSSPVPLEPAPELILLVSGHTAGWITPCGCPGSQAGGVARRAGYGDLLRKTFPGIPVVYLELGGFTSFGTPFRRSITEAVLQSMNRIGYEGANAASEDFGTTREESAFLDARLKVPRFSANVVFHDSGKLAFPPYRIFTGRPPPHGAAARIGVMGLMSENRGLFAFGEGGRSLVTIPMEEALSRSLPELRSRADIVVLFSESSIAPFYALLKKHRSMDLVVAGEGSHFILEPMVLEGTPLIATGNQGKYLAELRVYRKDGKPALKTIVHWLDERYPENQELATQAEKTLDHLNDLSRQDIEADTAPPPSIAPYLGAQACAPCHAAVSEQWQASRHAHAYATLRPLKRDYSESCVYCHVTATGVEVGGFLNPRATSQLLDVQCEQCHGPGQAHVADPGAPYGRTRPDLCIRCHTPATDPDFNRETAWQVIRHGVEASKAR